MEPQIAILRLIMMTSGHGRSGGSFSGGRDTHIFGLNACSYIASYFKMAVKHKTSSKRFANHLLQTEHFTKHFTFAMTNVKRLSRRFQNHLLNEDALQDVSKSALSVKCLVRC